MAAWNPFPHKPLQLVPPLQLLIAAPLTKQGVPSLSSAGEYSKVGREELLLPRKVKVGPSKETILVLGGELATHLVTTDPCLQTKENLLNEKKESG